MIKPPLLKSVIQSTNRNASEVLCTVNQVNENMHSEKYELKDELTEQQEGYRIKEVEEKNNIIEH